MEQKFEVGQTVWARMKGFPHWPAIVRDPPKIMLKKSVNPNLRCVLFFGTRNHAWIEISDLFDYEENKDKYGKNPKSPSIKHAIEDIEAFIKNGDATLAINEKDPFDQLINTTSSTPKISEPKRRSSQNSEKTKTDSSKRKKKALEPVSNFSTPNSINGDSYKSFSTSHYGLNRPSKRRAYVEPVNLKATSEELVKKKIKPSLLKIGFAGLGVVGSRLVKNLLHSNHKVSVWNRTEEKCQQFQEFGAQIANSPYELLAESDILFLSLENEDALFDVLFRTNIRRAIKQGKKSIVNLTSIGTEASENVSDLMEAYNCRFLGVRLVGTAEEADKGLMFCISAGDESLYKDCNTCFEAFTLKCLYIGSDFQKLGKVYSVFNTLSSVVSTGITETVSVCKKQGISVSQCLGLAAISPLLACSFMEKYKGFYEDRGEEVFPAIAPLTPDIQVPFLLKDNITEYEDSLISNLYPNSTS